LAVITTECPQSSCNVPNKYDKSKSANFRELSDKTVSGLATRFMDGMQLKDTEVAGTIGYEKFTF
jgi:hypothetical protein